MRISPDEAARLLANGHVVAVPTETVYGLAASLTQPKAVEAIFALKGRPANNPLIIHVASTSQLIPYVKSFPEGFERLAEAFWPGPMTIVLPVREEAVPEKVRAGLSTAAFRVPHHPLARELLQLAGPLVMPSANVSGRPSATSPEHVEGDFGIEFPVLDGGACERGLESTILIAKDGEWRVIRQGALPPEAFGEVLGYVPGVEAPNSKAPLCPGQLYRHYAPKAHLRLRDSFAEGMTGIVLGYSGRAYPPGLRVIALGTLSNAEEVAENLYRTLRLLDQEGIVEAWVDSDVPREGLWKTIIERLRDRKSVV